MVYNLITLLSTHWGQVGIFFNETYCILIQTSMRYVPTGPNDNNLRYLDIGIAPNRRQAII